MGDDYELNESKLDEEETKKMKNKKKIYDFNQKHYRLDLMNK